MALDVILESGIRLIAITLGPQGKIFAENSSVWVEPTRHAIASVRAISYWTGRERRHPSSGR